MNRTEMILKRPFRASQLKWRKGPGGIELVYITARDVMDRLDEAVGVDGWSSHLREVQGRVTCELSIPMPFMDATRQSGQHQRAMRNSWRRDITKK